MTKDMSLLVFVNSIILTQSSCYVSTLFCSGGIYCCLALLVRMIFRNLVAVVVNLVMAFWSMRVSMVVMMVVVSISFAIMFMSNNMRVMTNNMTFMVDFCVILMAMC